MRVAASRDRTRQERAGSEFALTGTMKKEIGHLKNRQNFVRGVRKWGKPHNIVVLKLPGVEGKSNTDVEEEGDRTRAQESEGGKEIRATRTLFPPAD